jgi:hypothetical protein
MTYSLNLDYDVDAQTLSEAEIYKARNDWTENPDGQGYLSVRLITDDKDLPKIKGGQVSILTGKNLKKSSDASSKKEPASQE